MKKILVVFVAVVGLTVFTACENETTEQTQDQQQVEQQTPVTTQETPAIDSIEVDTTK